MRGWNPDFLEMFLDNFIPPCTRAQLSITKSRIPLPVYHHSQIHKMSAALPGTFFSSAPHIITSLKNGLMGIPVYYIQIWFWAGGALTTLWKANKFPFGERGDKKPILVECLFSGLVAFFTYKTYHENDEQFTYLVVSTIPVLGWPLLGVMGNEYGVQPDFAFCLVELCCTVIDDHLRVPGYPKLVLWVTHTFLLLSAAFSVGSVRRLDVSTIVADATESAAKTTVAPAAFVINLFGDFLMQQGDRTTNNATANITSAQLKRINSNGSHAQVGHDFNGSNVKS